MRRLLVCACLLLAAAAPANAPTPGEAPPGPAAPSGVQWVPRGVAELVALNKIDAQSAKLQIRAGQSASYGSLTITVRSCQVRPPDMAPDATAWLDIVDSRPGAPSFHGWMLQNEPNLNSFEHPVYDIHLSACR
jgi:hypothetical protein